MSMYAYIHVRINPRTVLMVQQDAKLHVGKVDCENDKCECIRATSSAFVHFNAYM